MQIKRTLTFVDEVAQEAGQRVEPVLRKVAVVAVLDNPFAGRFEPDLSPLTEASAAIGRHISRLAMALLAPHKPASYGKEKRDEWTEKDYHKPSDQVKDWWDLGGAADDGKLLMTVGYRVAQADKFPEWKAGSEFKATREQSLGKK